MTSFSLLCDSLWQRALDIIENSFPEDDRVVMLVDAPEVLFNSLMNGYVCYTPRALYADGIFCMDEEPEDWDDLYENCNALMRVTELEVEGLVMLADFLSHNNTLTKEYNSLNKQIDAILCSQKGKVVFRQPVVIEYETREPDWTSTAHCRFIEDGWLGEEAYAHINAAGLTFKNKCAVVDAMIESKARRS